MPGGRLTRDDRRQVASGIAEGLGYAEIARRLDRPTSTISREVARNGGSDGYQADLAQRATGHRARRRKPLASPESPPVADAYGRDPDAVRGFVEEFADLMAEAGVPRMAARVLTCLYTTDSGGLTAADLVRQLRVSPASVSKAVGYLEGLDLVRRSRNPRRRRERYSVDDDVWVRAWTASTRKNQRWAAAAQRGTEIFDPGTPAGARLDNLGQFFARLSEEMSAGSEVPAAADDALTVLAALAHAGVPLTVDQLATALAWSPDRVGTALRIAAEHPEITDPVAPHSPTPGTYTLTARRHRLTQTQLTGLRP